MPTKRGVTMLFERVWGDRFESGATAVDVHAGALRSKLAHAGASLAIQTLRGAGCLLPE